MAGVVFGYEYFEGEIDGGARSREHERRPGGGIAEDQQLRVGHPQAGFRGFAAVINECEDLDAFRLERSLEARDGLIHAVSAGDGDDAIAGRFHECLREDMPMGCRGPFAVAESF